MPRRLSPFCFNANETRRPLQPPRLLAILADATQTRSEPVTDDSTIREELEKLGANGLALETLLFALMSEIQRSRLLDGAALTRVFDQADDTLTATALNLGAQAPPEYITRALKAVEEFRSEFGLSET